MTGYILIWPRGVIELPSEYSWVLIFIFFMTCRQSPRARDVWDAHAWTFFLLRLSVSFIMAILGLTCAKQWAWRLTPSLLNFPPLYGLLRPRKSTLSDNLKRWSTSPAWSSMTSVICIIEDCMYKHFDMLYTIIIYDSWHNIPRLEDSLGKSSRFKGWKKKNILSLEFCLKVPNGS